MAAAGLAALFRSCVGAAPDFGSDYEVRSAELSLQSLRFRLWERSVGMSEGSTELPSTIINRPDLQPACGQAVEGIRYLLEEIDGLRRRYQWQPSPPADRRLACDAKSRRLSQSLPSLASVRASANWRQRMHENQRQKPLVVITKWTLCDARKFRDRVQKLRALIDGLEDVTTAAGLAHCEIPDAALGEEDPPPYSAVEPIQQPPRVVASVYQTPGPERTAISSHGTPAAASLSALADHHRVMERYLSVWPDESRTPRSRVRKHIHALRLTQFQELCQDVYDELLRRQRIDDPVPQFLPPNASFHPRRNEARRRLSTLVRFQYLVSDIVFEYERRLRECHGRAVPPPPLLQHRAAHHSTIMDHSSARPTTRASIPLSAFNTTQTVFAPRGDTRRRSASNTLGTRDVHWPMTHVLAWLSMNHFSSEWQETFKALDISGSVFLGLDNVGSDKLTLMHRQVYPRLAQEYARSGAGWDQAQVRAEGDRLRRLVRRMPHREPATVTARTHDASVDTFKSCRVRMKDPTWKILPRALEQYHINARPELYALYVVYDDVERCLALDEKPLALFKKLEKAGKKPVFMLRARVSSPAAGSQHGA